MHGGYGLADIMEKLLRSIIKWRSFSASGLNGYGEKGKREWNMEDKCVVPWRGGRPDHSQGHSTDKYSEKLYLCCFVSDSQCYWVGMPGTS